MFKRTFLRLVLGEVLEGSDFFGATSKQWGNDVGSGLISGCDSDEIDRLTMVVMLLR